MNLRKGKAMETVKRSVIASKWAWEGWIAEHMGFLGHWKYSVRYYNDRYMWLYVNYGWRFMTLYRRQESRPSPRKRCKKAKWLSKEALQIAVKRRAVKSKGEKGRYSHLNAEFQRIARRDKKAFLSNQYKEIGETVERERLEISSRKLETAREHFMQKWAQ